MNLSNGDEHMPCGKSKGKGKGSKKSSGGKKK